MHRSAVKHPMTPTIRLIRCTTQAHGLFGNINTTTDPTVNIAPPSMRDEPIIGQTSAGQSVPNRSPSSSLFSIIQIPAPMEAKFNKTFR